MNNRTTLYLLMGLAVAAIGGRLWSTHYLETWQTSLTEHERRYKVIYETTNDLQERRKEAPKGSDDIYFRQHFQSQAFEAQMGSIDVNVRRRTQANHEDKIFEVDFAVGEDGFRRDQLRTFLFNAELLMPRVRTTILNLKPRGPKGRGRGIDPGVEREDIWKIDKLEFRQRSPVAPKKN
ncbi:MAG: hypothetical protein ACPG31_13060 [Planctomycetota bacterium]